MKKARIFIYLLCLLSLTAFSAHAQTRRPMTAADTLRIANVNDAQISPDGARIVYTVSTTEGNETRTTLWLARVGSNYFQVRHSNDEPRQLLPDDWTASNPRWSPDGKLIAFLATHDGQSGIWVMALADRNRISIRKPNSPTSEATVLAHPPRFIAPVRSTNFFITYAGENFAWSPDSRRIAYINATEDANDANDSATRKEQTADDPRVINRIQYKSRTSFSDRARTHVWLTDVEQSNPRQLTAGAYYDHAVTFSPRGDEIAYLSNHEPDADAVNNSDIFAVNTDGRTRQITNTKGCEYEPAWSPDGKLIAYTATKRPVTTIDSVAEDAHVWVIDASGGTGRELTAAQDRRARSPRWSPDNRAVLFLANDHGRALVYRIELADNKLSSIFDAPDPQRAGCPPPDMLVSPTNSFQVGGFSISALPAQVSSKALIAFTLSTPMLPPEVYVQAAQASCAPNLNSNESANNAEFMGSRVNITGEARTYAQAMALPIPRLVVPEEINFKSFDGTPVQGWLMKPLDFKEGQRYPLILSVHGGPHGAYGYSFNSSFQVYAARGYAVLYLNPRGSTGYGQKFSDGTINEWGGGDYQDLMRGVDEALRRNSWIDPNRLGVTGGSYGGFMTNWIITQTPRFRAAVASASVSNLVSFYATSLYQDLIHAEFNGFPWDNYDTLWRWSPIRYVKQAQTPTLFLHGEQDNDVHITQAEEMYMALRRRGVETELVRYPREGHGLREPRHRVDALERTLDWFDHYLKQ